jgi:hypothetical protein
MVFLARPVFQSEYTGCNLSLVAARLFFTKGRGAGSIQEDGMMEAPKS